MAHNKRKKKIPLVFPYLSTGTDQDERYQGLSLCLHS